MTGREQCILVLGAMVQSRGGSQSDEILKQLKDSQLSELAGKKEARLAEIKTEIETIEPKFAEISIKIRNATKKLAVNVVIAVTGIAAAPMTLGWSLFAAVGGCGMVALELNDIANDNTVHEALRRQMHGLRLEVSDLADDLEAIRNEMLRRRS